MLRLKSIRAALLLPAAVIVAFLVSAGSLRATQADIDNLNAQLRIYAQQKSTTDTAPAPGTNLLATAPADDVVYAVYTVLNANAGGAYTASANIGELVASALTGRSDGDVIITRLIKAALVGSQNDAAIGSILDKTAGSPAVSILGKAYSIAEALKDVNPTSNQGAAIASRSNTYSAQYPPLSLQAWNAAVLGLVPVQPGNIAGYIDAVLDSAPGDKNAFAVGVAAALTANPQVAGAVIQGRASDILGNLPATPASDVAIVGLVNTALGNPTIAGTSSTEVAAGGFKLLSLAQSRDQAATSIASGKPAGVKGGLAGGAIQAIGGGGAGDTVQGIINHVLTAGGSPSDVDIILGFAPQVSKGNANDGTVVATITNTLVSNLSSTNRTTPIYLAYLGVYISNGLGTTNPDGAQVALRTLLSNGSASGLNTTSLLPIYASFIAGNVADYTTAGAAVAGVAASYVALNPGQTTVEAAATLSAAALPAGANANVATSVAQKVSQFVITPTGGANNLTFATSLATKVGGTALAGNIAAGVSLNALDSTGDIVAAVSGIDNSHKAAALNIAFTAANNVNVERIADIGQKIAAQYNTNGTGLPDVTAVGNLALYLGYAINTKPLVNWHNRVDELGELAAVLTTQALANVGSSSDTTAKRVPIIGGIAMNLFNSVLAPLVLQINAGTHMGDLKDIAQDVAGAILQSISVSSLSNADKLALLSTADTATGIPYTLHKYLTYFAGAYSASIEAAFADVNGAGVGNIVVGNEGIGKNGVVTSTGKYEIGYVIDDETPVINL